MKLAKAFVFRGEGIECEEELFRALKLFQGKKFSDLEYWNLPAVRRNPEFFYSKLNKNDWVFLPGGFSFSDHFGSGRLLANLLNQTQFLPTLLERGAHAMGICNGFQALVALGGFGENVKLLSNNPTGFVDRWVDLEGFNSQFKFAVRHGEGRLTGVTQSDPAVKIFLKYRDSDFSNGSEDKAAGLFRKFPEGSCLWGLMPHPEVAMRKRDDPAYRGPLFNQKSQTESWLEPGDGLRFFEKIFFEFSEGDGK